MEGPISYLFSYLASVWHLYVEASIYVFFGLLVGGMLKVFLDPSLVAKHLGAGRFRSVFKAALLGIPLPLCSCGVLPAAASLKRQGANNGAVTAFLISTPESGVDSIAISYALLDPLMTVARPVAAFFTAAAAGILENVVGGGASSGEVVVPNLACTVDACCPGTDCPAEEHRRHHTFLEKVRAGLGFALGDLWSDLAGWFTVGMLLAGAISVLVPPTIMGKYLGGGLPAMLLMLVIGVPLYICATASTPIAAALILKGVSPGAALVFLLAGPATNVTSLTVLFGLLGRRATAIYLGTLAVATVAFGLAVDRIYSALGILPQAVVGQAAEILPEPVKIVGAAALLILSIKPLLMAVKKLGAADHHGDACATACCSAPDSHAH
jgi:hypothetical protein